VAERGAFRALVLGRVQGVGFRYSAVSAARRLRVDGLVRNLPDGSVEVEAEGAQGDLDVFVEWLRRGPPGAHVRDVQVTPLPAAGRFNGFQIDF
jgi:acylphosphatase